MLKNIVDSVKFNHVPIALDSVKYTDSFIYFDFDSHAILHIPTNWDEKGLIKDNEFLDVKFASIRQKGCFILYGSTDIWEQLPDAEKTGRTRADINNQAFTEADIAEMYHIAADKVSVVTYDDIQYYQGENSVETDGLRVPVRQLVYIENGWVYTFQFGGIDSDLYVKDFEDLLDSVSYYRASNDSYDRDILAEPESPGINAITIVVIILFLIVAGIIVVGVILCNKKTAVRPVQTNIGTPAPTVICCNCGKTLPEGNRFCHICGAEIKKKEHS